jgi:hypothetical protein
MKKKLNGLHIVVPMTLIFFSTLTHAADPSLDPSHAHLDQQAPPPGAILPPSSSNVAQPPAESADQEYLGQAAGNYTVQSPHQLSAGDLQSMGITVSPSADMTSHSKVSVTLSGMVFQVCLDKFPIVISQATSADGTETGYQINEPNFVSSNPSGSFEACQEGLRAAGHKCGDLQCSPMSAQPGATIDLSRAGDVAVGIFHVDPSQDSTDPVFENIGDNELEHLSASTILANKKAAAKAYRDAKIAMLEATAKNCVKDSDQIAQATSACDLLTSMLNTDSDDIGHIFAPCAPAKLAKEQVMVLNKDIQAVDLSDPDAVQSALDEISQFASDNPDQADAASSAYLSLMNKYLTKPNASSADYAAAQQLAGLAGNVDGVSAAQASVVANDVNQVQYQSLAAQGSSPNFSPMTFFPAYQSLAQQAGQAYSQACGSSTGGASSQACVSSYQFFQQVAALPNKIGGQQQQQQALNAQINQSIAQAMSSYGSQTSSMSTGLPGMSGASGYAPAGSGAGPSGPSGMLATSANVTPGSVIQNSSGQSFGRPY